MRFTTGSNGSFRPAADAALDNIQVAAEGIEREGA